MIAAQQQLSHPKYRPDIDGLRAVAVLSVVAYHYFPEQVSGGFTGVDVFFVISGFLISSIIFGSLANDRFSYREFYARRIKRIFPALLLVLAVTLGFGWYVLFSDEFAQLGKHVAGGAGFAANLVLWSEAGYFDAAAETKPLLHLWSLGVEEQFYILWPLLLGFVWRRNLNFLRVTLLVAVLSFVINLYWIDRDPVALFFSPFSRIWELMIGGILAYMVLHGRAIFSGNGSLSILLSLLGLGLIIASVFMFDRYTPFPGWWALLPTVGTALVIASPQANWLNSRVLGNPVMVWFGLISYPLYLWHWPLLAFARILDDGMPDIGTRFVLVGASILLASITFLLIEKRFRTRYSNAAILFLSSAMALILVLGLVASQGVYPPRMTSKYAEIVVAAKRDWGFPGKLQRLTMDDTHFFVASAADSKTLFIGDSHMEQYAPRVVQALQDDPGKNTAVFATFGGCPPIPSVFEPKRVRCPELMQKTLEYLDRPDVEVVVIGARWHLYFLTATRDWSHQETPDLNYYFLDNNDGRHKFLDDDGATLAKQALESFIATLARNKRVYLLLDNPSGHDFSPKTILEGSRLSQFQSARSVGKEVYAAYDPEQQQLREEFKALAARAGADVLDPVARLCNQQRCKVTTKDGTPIYRDNDHLRPFYVEEFADFIDDTLR